MPIAQQGVEAPSISKLIVFGGLPTIFILNLVLDKLDIPYTSFTDLLHMNPGFTPHVPTITDWLLHSDSSDTVEVPEPANDNELPVPDAPEDTWQDSDNALPPKTQKAIRDAQEDIETLKKILNNGVPGTRVPDELIEQVEEQRRYIDALRRGATPLR